MKALGFIFLFCVWLLWFSWSVQPQQPEPAKAAEFPPKSGRWLILCKDTVDGDTVDFYWLVPDRARLFGIDAPESQGPTVLAGQKSKAYLTTLLPAGPTSAVMHGREKYGRALLDIHDYRGKSLSSIMIEKGYAEPWKDGK